MKNPIFVVALVLLLCFVFGCQNKAEKAELEKFRTQAKVEERNKEFVKRYVDELNKGNVEVCNEMNAPEYGFYSPSNNPTPMSQEKAVELIKMIFKAFPDVNWKIERLFAVGDTVIIWNVVTGTHQAEFQGIPATGNKIEVSSILMWTLKNGKLVEEREEANLLGMMQQLGLELKPKEAEKR